MTATLTVFDETTSGKRSDPILLEFLTEHITVGEVIRQRVYQEVRDYNVASAQGTTFRGLIQPTDTEKTLNGYQMKSKRTVDWKQQYERALAGFAAGQILVLVNDRQADTLEQQVTITPDAEVAFLRLVPLVGG